MKEAIKKYLKDTMVFVKGGEFIMGSEELYNGQPIHKVKLENFSINKFLVTQKFYEWVIGNNPSYFKGRERPVEQVNWFDAIQFCNELSKLSELDKLYYNIEKDLKGTNEKDRWIVNIQEDSKGYRLPTEAEWEYVARGGVFWRANFKHSGNDHLKEIGWYIENSHSESKEVGLKEANKLGLYDLSGNIREWCWDWYGEYKEETEKNPIGTENSIGKLARGGSWFYHAYHSWVATRHLFSPYLRNANIGFRISRTV